MLHYSLNYVDHLWMVIEFIIEELTLCVPDILHTIFCLLFAVVCGHVFKEEHYSFPGGVGEQLMCYVTYGPRCKKWFSSTQLNK